MATRDQLLQNLKNQILADITLPLRDSATQLVFGEGDPNAKIYFLGEAPGATEDRLGRPFVGSAGKLLEKLLHSAGLTREQVYISNTVRFRPPNNRPPTPSEIAAFLPYVDQEIQIIKPKIIATLGRFSLQKFLPDAKISQVHGQLQNITWHDLNLTILPLFHPAAALRRKEFKLALEQDFQKLAQLC